VDIDKRNDVVGALYGIDQRDAGRPFQFRILINFVIGQYNTASLRTSLVAHPAILIARGRLGEFTVLVDDDAIFTSESDRTVARDGFSMHPRAGIMPRSFFAIGIDGDDGGALILGAFGVHHAAIT